MCGLRTRGTLVVAGDIVFGNLAWKTDKNKWSFRVSCESCVGSRVLFDASNVESRQRWRVKSYMPKSWSQNKHKYSGGFDFAIPVLLPYSHPGLTEVSVIYFHGEEIRRSEFKSMCNSGCAIGHLLSGELVVGSGLVDTDKRTVGSQVCDLPGEICDVCRAQDSCHQLGDLVQRGGLPACTSFTTRCGFEPQRGYFFIRVSIAYDSTTFVKTV